MVAVPRLPQAPAIAGNTSLSDGEQRFFRVATIDLRPATAQALVDPTSVPFYEHQTTDWRLDSEADALLQSTLGSLAIESSPQVRQWSNAFLQAWLTSPPEQLPQALARFFADPPLKLEDPPIDRLLRLRMNDRGRADNPQFPAATFIADLQAFISADAGRWRALLVPPRAQETPALVGNVEDDGLPAPDRGAAQRTRCCVDSQGQVG